MVLRVVLLLIYSHDYSYVFSFGRSGDYYLLGAAFSYVVLGSLYLLTFLIYAVFLDREKTRRFDDYLDAKVLPGKFRGIPLCQDFYDIAVNGDRILGYRLYFTGKPAVDRIIF